MTLKDRVRADLTAAMKARDAIRRNTLRMLLAAITNEEVSGDAARELTDAETITVINREVKKRTESAEAFLAGNRPELAARENAESAVLSEYLPRQLSDDELESAVAAAIAQVADATGQAPTRKQLGQVIKAAQARVAGQATGSRVAAAVQAALPA